MAPRHLSLRRCNLPARIRKLAERKAGACAELDCMPARAVQQPGGAQSLPLTGSSLNTLHWPPSLPRPAVRKAKARREAVKFSWLYDRPLQLQYNEMPTARARGVARA